MSSRKVKINGVQTKFAFNKNKKYKYNKSGGLEEATTIADDDIIMSGSKSSLRRMADLERNISILATKLMTTDGGATDVEDNDYGRIEKSDIRFKGDVRIDDELDMRDHIDMNNNRVHSLGTPSSGSDAANKSYVDAREAAAEATASADATSKANSAKTSAISSASADATSKANAAKASAISTASADATAKADAAEASAISAAASDATSKANSAKASAISTASADATSKANAAQAAAISAVTNGAGAAFNTLKEIQDAMATDAELSSAIASVTAAAASTASADATAKANAALAAALAADSDTTYSVGDGGLTQRNFTSALKSKLDGIAAGATNVTNNNQLANGAGYITSYTDTNTTYSAGNGLSLSGTTFSMSGSYTGNFTASGDITAYSDDSLKTNVQVIDGALGKVEAIRGVTFDRIEDGSTSTGVIAQELEAVLPEAVKQDENGVRHVAYGNITGLLIEAVKELSAQVAELKKK